MHIPIDSEINYTTTPSPFKIEEDIKYGTYEHYKSWLSRANYACENKDLKRDIYQKLVNECEEYSGFLNIEGIDSYEIIDIFLKLRDICTSKNVSIPSKYIINYYIG